MTVEIDAEEREITETRLYITINNSEFRATTVIDFLESIMGTDGYMTGVRATGPSERLAEALEEEGVVGKTYSAGWHETDEEAVNDLWEKVMSLYHDDLSIEEVNADEWRR